MENVISFSTAKRRFSLSIISVGDYIEWQDEHGDHSTSKVTRIEYKPIDGWAFSESLQSMLVQEKEEFILWLEDGCTIIGDLVVRKVLKKDLKKKTNRYDGMHRYV